VKAMLRAEIGDRPNVAEVLRHPWMLVDMPPELAALNDRLVQVGAASATTRTRSMMVNKQEFYPAWSPGLIATCSSRWRLCPCGPGVVPATVVPPWCPGGASSRPWHPCTGACHSATPRRWPAQPRVIPRWPARTGSCRLDGGQARK